jgi:VWFA-related protein
MSRRSTARQLRYSEPPRLIEVSVVSVLRVALIVTLVAVPVSITGQSQAPTFRAGTVLVPIDVRVIDRRTHKPVTNLRQDEFIVTENNVRQRIGLFSTQALVADEAAASQPLLQASVAPTSLGPQKRRTFLIVLGRGRLQTWSGVLDSLRHLITERLLPQDYVAVMAFNRATDFTTDHERIAAVVERFRKNGQMADLQLGLYGQVAGRFAGSYVPKPAQALIDGIFKGPDNAPVRTVPAVPISDAARLANDQRRISDALLNNELNAARDPTFQPSPFDAPGIDMTFDEYVSASTQTSQDIAKLYAGISYLRHLDGEKHMIFVTERGLTLPRAEDDDGLAAMAADARVVIDVFHTGGATRAADITSSRGAGVGSRAAVGDWALSTSRTVAARTGGKFAVSQSGRDFVDQLDAATRFSYLLGYYPTNSSWDGTYRKINVQVTRPGAFDIQFRHGYRANLDLKPLDKPKTLALMRVASAASTAEPITDIALTVTAENVSVNGGWSVDVAVMMRPEQLRFSEKNGARRASVDVAIFCVDDKDRLLGERWTLSDLAPSPEALAKVQVPGLRYSTRVNVTAPARYVKVIVYDRGADVLGSNLTKLDIPKVRK